MTFEQQLALVVLVSVLTLGSSIITTLLNNRLERQRLNASSERDRQERREEYRRQRLEEESRPISDWTKQVVEFADFVREAGHLAYPFDSQFGQEIPQLRSETTNIKGFLERFESDLSSRSFTMSESIEVSRPQVLASVVSIGDGGLARSIDGCTDSYRKLHNSLMRLGNEIKEIVKSDSPISSQKALAVQQALERMRNDGAVLVMSVASVNQNLDRILASLEIVPLSEVEAERG